MADRPALDRPALDRPALDRIGTNLARVGYRRLLRPLLFRIGDGDPEAAHEQMLDLLGRAMDRPLAAAAIRALHPRRVNPVEFAGIEFANPVGLAAGLDKRGEAIPAWAALGFGHVEIGTVTPRPQPGNPRPRIQRLPRSGAIINAMGFPSDGAAALAERLSTHGIVRGGQPQLRIGISLGKNADTALESAAADYVTSLRTLHRFADYFAVNVSSPNTPRLRSLQDPNALTTLLAELTTAARRADPADPVPIMIKISPDLTRGAVDELLTVCADTAVAGLICGNTTTSRDGVRETERSTAWPNGGLSGHPLTRRARTLVRYLVDHTPLPVIGVGGIMTSSDAAAMFDAGARLVQLYTGWIYSGPGLVTAAAALPGVGSRRSDV